MADTILEVSDLHYHYGKIHALDGISFQVPEGNIIAIIGSNGAGKTTTLRCISGFLERITSGTILFMGERIDRMPPHKIVSLGLVQVLEGRMVFPQLTVKENLAMGAYLRTNKKEVGDTLDYVYSLFPRLLEREGQLAGTLSGGEQQMLAVGRALMSKPKMLMMDEPSLGLAPFLIQEIFKTIRKINSDGVTVLLVEQNSSAALAIADSAYVFESGKVILQGAASELLANDSVKKTYLGL